MMFIDTNYFLRLFIDDKSPQHTKATEFFLAAATHHDTFMTSTLVLFEVYWVLKSFYKQEKIRLIVALETIVKMDFIELADRLILMKALSRFSKSSLELEDCFHIEFAKAARCISIATFDMKLTRAFED